jgi:hypothetical protein
VLALKVAVHIRLPGDHVDLVLIGIGIANVVTKIIVVAFLGDVLVGVEIKVEPLAVQYLPANAGKTYGIEALEYAAVFPQHFIDIQDRLFAPALFPVVSLKPALVRTVYFIFPAV